jgi:Fe-S-cluster containining protein
MSTTADTATVNLAATVGGCELKMSVTVPAGPTRIDDFLPLLQIVSDHVVGASEREAERQGKCVSCSKGCGACCRQLVPISPVDARNIARLVSEMPQPRKAEILARFTAARRRLEEADMWERLNRRQDWPEDGVSQIGLEYFYFGIPCPFLEDESCSIHRERPLTCREYLVTSPAENCANPAPDVIDWVPMLAKVWTVAARCEPGASEDRYLNWIPLVQALDWAADHPPPPAESSGPELLRQVLQRVGRTSQESRSKDDDCQPVSPLVPQSAQ